MGAITDTIRFEVLINGSRRCVAGVNGTGVVSVITDWVMRDAQNKPANRTLESWTKQRLNCHVGGCSNVPDQAFCWLSESIAVGDEITIRVLGPGEFDEPPENSEDHA